MLVKLRGLEKRFGTRVAVHPLDLDVAEGEFLAILGPSGCGKTTLLRMIGGFSEPTGGTIEIAGEDVTRLAPERRSTNMVFQGYGLFPHMNVRQNVGYGLRLRGTPTPDLATQVRDMLRLVHLDDYAETPVNELSGGQQQRVAVARALIMRPAVLLLDEPLGALDLQLRKHMQAELRRIHRSLGGTFIFVTHDQEEALGLANRIAVMENGKLVQEGDPQQIYRNPASQFVSTFIGDANLLQGRRDHGIVHFGAGASFAHPGPDGAVSVVIRPEMLRLSASGPLAGSVTDCIFLGAYTRLLIKLDDGNVIAAHLSQDISTPLPTLGERVSLGWGDMTLRCIDAAT